MYSKPDVTTGADSGKVEARCDQTNTGFGIINYKKIDGIEFTSAVDQNIIRETGQVNCAVRCFEKAGCSAFFVDNNGCTYIIGEASYGDQNDNVTHSGTLNNLCPSTSFTSTFTRRSQFFCLIWAPNQGDTLADSIVAQNAGNSANLLRSWSFETQSNNPMVTSSQYVSVEMPDMEGNDSRFRPIIFTIETHIRIGKNDLLARKRRSTNRESEFVLVGEITKNIDKRLQKEAQTAAKQRVILPRTDDMLAEIEAIERQATSFILSGDMELPNDAQVAATGPIETVEFVQTAADGSITADCSTGSCQCSVGFFDYGNGCVETNEDQTITPSIATTTSTSTLTFSTTSTTEITSTSTSTTPKTTIVSITTTKTIKPTSATWNNGSESVRFWLTALVDDKLQAVFEHQRPKRARNHLFKKWKNLSDRFVRRYRSMIDNGCNFPDTYDEYSVDFNSVSNPVCYVS